MSYVDKTIECADCGASFTFSASEQQLFADKGYTNEPKRCRGCREVRKQQQGGANRSSYSGQQSYGYQPQRTMHAAVCASCGKPTQVPFEPRNGRPVYCSDCYARVKPSTRV